MKTGPYIYFIIGGIAATYMAVTAVYAKIKGKKIPWLRTPEEGFENAIASNSLSSTKRWLKKGAVVNRKDNPVQPLYLAIFTGAHIKIIRLLIEAGADVNHTVNQMITPFYWALVTSRFDVAEELIKTGSKTDLKAADGTNYLIFAATNDKNLKFVKLLLDQGLNINDQNNDGITALMSACQYNKKTKMIEELIKYGADKNMRDKNGKTAKDYLRDNKKLKKKDLSHIFGASGAGVQRMH